MLTFIEIFIIVMNCLTLFNEAKYINFVHPVLSIRKNPYWFLKQLNKLRVLFLFKIIRYIFNKHLWVKLITFSILHLKVPNKNQLTALIFPQIEVQNFKNPT